MPLYIPFYIMYEHHCGTSKLCALQTLHCRFNIWAIGIDVIVAFSVKVLHGDCFYWSTKPNTNSECTKRANLIEKIGPQKLIMKVLIVTSVHTHMYFVHVNWHYNIVVLIFPQCKIQHKQAQIDRKTLNPKGSHKKGVRHVCFWMKGNIYIYVCNLLEINVYMHLQG